MDRTWIEQLRIEQADQVFYHVPESDVPRMMDSEPLPPPAPPPESAASADARVAPPAASARNTALRAAFAGPYGIHAAPRWLLYLLLAYVVFKAEQWLLASAGSTLNTLWWRFMIEATMMLAVILPAFVMARIEARRFGDFGLPARGAFTRNFWVGTLWGVAALSLLMLALRATGAFTLGAPALHGPRIWKFALYYALFFLCTALFEEFLLRGYSQWVLTQGMSFWAAATLLSILFGAIHASNGGESASGLVAAGLIGFFFCLTLRRTGTLWWAVGFHMSWDWGESYLYSVPDSGTLLPGHLMNSTFHGPPWLTGASVGPEGSYLVFPLIAALWMVFDRVYPQVKYGVGEISGRDEGCP